MGIRRRALMGAGISYTNLMPDSSFEVSGVTNYNYYGLKPTVVTTGQIYHGTKCIRTVSSSSNISYVYKDIAIANAVNHELFISSMAFCESFEDGAKVSRLTVNEYGVAGGTGMAIDPTNHSTWQQLGTLRTITGQGIRITMGRAMIGTGLELTRFDAVLIVDITTEILPYFAFSDQAAKLEWCKQNLAYTATKGIVYI